MIVDEWLGTLRSSNTKSVYKAGLKHFAEAAMGEGDFNKIVEKYVSKVKAGHNPFEDLLTFAVTLVDTPPKTVGAYVPGILNFLDIFLG